MALLRFCKYIQFKRTVDWQLKTHCLIWVHLRMRERCCSLWWNFRSLRSVCRPNPHSHRSTTTQTFSQKTNSYHVCKEPTSEPTHSPTVTPSTSIPSNSPSKVQTHPTYIFLEVYTLSTRQQLHPPTCQVSPLSPLSNLHKHRLVSYNMNMTHKYVFPFH